MEAATARGLDLGPVGAAVLWRMYSMASCAGWLMGSARDYERALDLIDN